MELIENEEKWQVLPNDIRCQVAELKTLLGLVDELAQLYTKAVEYDSASMKERVKSELRAAMNSVEQFSFVQ